MMILLTFEDGAGSVELFGEDEAHHLVGEGHQGEGHHLLGAVVDGFGEAVGAADDEDEASAALLLLTQPCGEVEAPALDAVLVEEDNGVAGLYQGENELALFVLLLVLGEVAGVAELGDDMDVEGHIVVDTVAVVVDARDIEFVCRLADEDE